MLPMTNREVDCTTLDNGVRVITEQMPHVRSASIGVWIGTGARSETASENGICHFLEHMLFKGTANRSAEDIAREVDSIGGHMDAFTAKELVSYNIKALDRHLPLAVDILSDLVLNPVFAAEDIEKEKGVILEELKMEIDNPEYLVHEIFSSKFWKGHPLGWPILGTRATINSFQREGLADYHFRYYKPSNILVTAAGNLRHRELVDLVANRFGLLKDTGPVPAYASPRTNAGVTLRNKRSLHQVHLCMGTPSYPLAHELRFACYILNVVLGGGMSSRLFQNVREKLGLAYAIFSELSLYRDTGCLAVYAGTSLESTPRVVDLILREFSELKDRPLTDEELRRAKEHLKGSMMLGLESTSSRMGNLARQALYFGRFFSLDEMADSIEQVTSAQVQSVAQEFLKQEQINLTVLGRIDGLSLSQEDLRC
ncbi:MAG: pitrilysin family protein [Bryobacteraceae bacterium]|nr:pitrilysin family protein [Bryobacteraceae bacterium]